MNEVVGIINYEAGNICSVHRAFSYLGSTVRIVNHPEEISTCTHLVLPGVGSFKAAMNSLHRLGFVNALIDYTNSSRPLLGICLGMQLLASRSSEDGVTKGLDLIKGDVERFDFIPTPELKIPHVGFTSTSFSTKSRLFKGFSSEPDFYFTHSYRLKTEDHSFVASTSFHGEFFTASVESNLIAGTQFHPEKSQKNGLRLLENFLLHF